MTRHDEKKQLEKLVGFLTRFKKVFEEPNGLPRKSE